MSVTTVAGSFITLNTINSDHYVDGSIDLVHIGANQIDGTKIALGSDAQGDIMYYDGTNWVRLGFGTSGHFLKTQGTGANPVWAAAAGGPSQATQSDIEARTNQDTYIAPDMLQFHDGVAKAWSRTGTWPGSGQNFTISDSYNVVSIADNGSGLFTHTWDTDFASANTYVNGGWGSEGRTIGTASNASASVGSSQNTAIVSDSGGRTDSDPIMFVAFGDQ